MKKFKPPEWPLLEVRRFFQWCQGMTLGILKRFREKKYIFFEILTLVQTFRELSMMGAAVVCVFENVRCQGRIPRDELI